jgi:Ser/Thr protein kinase RdoA (MazF antagonist)
LEDVPGPLYFVQWCTGGVDAAELAGALRARWGLSVTDVSKIEGGMNSSAWQVIAAGTRWVAKLVPQRDRPGFSTGLRAATLVQAAGIESGVPVTTLDDGYIADLPTGCLALLRWVDGVSLAGDEGDLGTIGSTLGAAHSALAGATPGEAPRLHWVETGAEHLDVEAWVRPAVAAAVRECDELVARLSTWGLLHGDPAPEAFLWSASTGRCGLIDWSSSFHGPLLYDLASAVMYVGGPARAAALIAAYRAEALLDDDEVAIGLLPMLRFRWAVQADYFARRIASNDLTGITDPAENHTGLNDARHHLTTM